MDDYVEHIFREQNQEANHWANLGAEGQRTVVVDRGNNTERWKAVRGFWDGSSKVNGRSGCGVVSNGVDRDKWITISKIAVLLGIGTATTAAVMGVCVLTGIVGSCSPPQVCVKNTNQCIDTIRKKSLMWLLPGKEERKRRKRKNGWL